MVVWNKSFAKWFSAEYMIERFFFSKMYGNKDKDSPYQCDLMSLSGAQEIQSRSYWPRVSMLLHGLQKAKTKTIIFKYLWPKMGCYKYVTNAFVLTQRELKTTVNGYRMNEISPKGNLLSLCFALSHWHARIKLFINRFGAPSLINALIYRWH